MKHRSQEPRHAGTIAKRIGIGSAGAALAVAALMALVPMTAAATPSLIHISPKIFGATISTGTTAGACGTAKITKSPSYSPRSQIFRGSISASSPACKPQSSENEGIAYWEGLMTTTKLAFPTSGNHFLNFSWLFNVNESWSMTPYTHCAVNYADPASICDTYVEDTLYVQPILFDNSNSSWGPFGAGLAFSNSIDLYTFSFAYVQNSSCSGCNFSFGTPGAGSFVGTLNGTNSFNLSGTSVINKADKFSLQIIVEVECLTFAYKVDASTHGTPSASASINAGTSGNGVKLVGATIS